MLSNDEVQRLRHDLDKVLHLTADISQRLDSLEARHEQPAISPGQQELATPPPLVSISGVQEEKPVLWDQHEEEVAYIPRNLHSAARQGDIPLAKECLDEGDDIDEIINDESPLDVAVGCGLYGMVRFLVANGARIDHTPVDGKSQIRRAQELAYNDIADFLQKKIGAKSTHEDSIVVSPADTPVVQTSDGYDLWVMISEGPIGQFVHERIEDFRSKTRDQGWEVLLGTYMLSRVAVTCIAIAVVFFLTLAIERWGAAWMPHLRVGIGYAVSVGLLALAWRFETKYSGLARVMYGGGFAIMYFVTFATHYIKFAQIFPSSPVPTLILLTLVVAAWAIAAQIRQSKIIAVMVTVLGHLTVLISTLTLDNTGPFSMIGLVALSAGSAFFLLRNRWYYVASLGLLGSYGNDFVALANGRAGDPYMDFAGSMGVLVAFFLIFALAEVFSPEDLRRKTIPTWFRNAFVTFNSVIFLTLGTMVMSHFEFTRDHQDVFRFAAASALLVISVAYLQFRAGDPLFNVYMVKAIALATLALATRYGGDALSAGLAIEMVVLLVSARQSGLIVIRLMAIGVGGIVFFQTMGSTFQIAFGVDAWSSVDPARLNLITVAYTDPDYRGILIRAALGIAAFLFSSQLYQRTQWVQKSPKTAPFAPETLCLLWQLDIIAERPEAFGHKEKPCKGLLFPYLYALAGTLLFLAYTFPLVQEGYRFGVLAGFVLALTICAALLDSLPFGLAAVALLLLAVLPISSNEIWSLNIISLPEIIVGLIAIYAAALASEESYFGKRIGLAFHQNEISPYLLYGVPAWLTGLLLVREFPGVNGAFALAAAAVFTSCLYLVLNSNVFAVIFGAFMLWAGIIFVPEAYNHYNSDPVRYVMAAVVLVGIALLADRYFSLLRKRTANAPYLCSGLILYAIIVLLCHWEITILREWLMTALALTACGFLVYAALFRTSVAAYGAVAVLFFASTRLIVETFNITPLPQGQATAFILLVVLALLADRYFSFYKKRMEIDPYLSAGLVINSMIVLLYYFEAAVQPAWLMAATALACFCYLGYAGLFRSPTAALVSVAGIIYASCRHTTEAYDAASLEPGFVIAFALLAIFWILSERLYIRLASKYDKVFAMVTNNIGYDPRRPETALAPIALSTLLLLVMLERIPSLVPVNLVFITLGWFALAAALFILSWPFSQRFYRYAGLAVIVLSLGRLFLIDMKEQDPLLRVAAFAIVGTGLLCISIGYYKWVARTSSEERNDANTTQAQKIYDE